MAIGCTRDLQQLDDFQLIMGFWLICNCLMGLHWRDLGHHSWLSVGVLIRKVPDNHNVDTSVPSIHYFYIYVGPPRGYVPILSINHKRTFGNLKFLSHVHIMLLHGASVLQKHFLWRLMFLTRHSNLPSSHLVPDKNPAVCTFAVVHALTCLFTILHPRLWCRSLKTKPING